MNTGAFSLPVRLSPVCAAAFAPDHAGSRQGTCGAMAVMFKSLLWGHMGQSVAEGLSSGIGAEPPSREQGALLSQAEPEPPDLLPWPRAPSVSS